MEYGTAKVSTKGKYYSQGFQLNHFGTRASEQYQIVYHHLHLTALGENM
jgi:hypothetical protein